MSEALDLTRAARALFVDRDWVPANNAQAESRLAGHDQRNPVVITTLVADRFEPLRFVGAHRSRDFR